MKTITDDQKKNLMITIMGILAPYQMPLSHNFETFEKVVATVLLSPAPA